MLKITRYAGAVAALGLLILFLGDLACPGPREPPRPARPPRLLAALLKELPPRNVGRFGEPGDPLSMVFLGSEEEVRGAFAAAGWTNVPLRIPASFRAGLREVLSGRSLRSCPPMNLYRLEGRVQDLNWSKPITPISKRHHFRLWRTSWRDEKGTQVWWGSGNFDLAIRWRDLSHIPDPDNDSERDFIAQTLAGSPWIARVSYQAAAQLEREGRNDKGYPFHADGRVLIVRLKRP